MHITNKTEAEDTIFELTLSHSGSPRDSFFLTAAYNNHYFRISVQPDSEQDILTGEEFQSPRLRLLELSLKTNREKKNMKCI